MGDKHKKHVKLKIKTYFRFLFLIIALIIFIVALVAYANRADAVFNKSEKNNLILKELVTLNSFNYIGKNWILDTDNSTLIAKNGAKTVLDENFKTAYLGNYEEIYYFYSYNEEHNVKNVISYNGKKINVVFSTSGLYDNSISLIVDKNDDVVGFSILDGIKNYNYSFKYGIVFSFNESESLHCNNIKNGNNDSCVINNSENYIVFNGNNFVLKSFKNNNVITTFTDIDDIYQVDEDKFVVQRNSKYGVKDSKDVTVLECKYNGIRYDNGNYAIYNGESISIIDKDLNDIGEIATIGYDSTIFTLRSNSNNVGFKFIVINNGYYVMVNSKIYVIGEDANYTVTYFNKVGHYEFITCNNEIIVYKDYKKYDRHILDMPLSITNIGLSSENTMLIMTEDYKYNYYYVFNNYDLVNYEDYHTGYKKTVKNGYIQGNKLFDNEDNVIKENNGIIFSVDDDVLWSFNEDNSMTFYIIK